MVFIDSQESLKKNNFIKKTAKTKFNNSNPIAILRHTDMLMMVGNYESPEHIRSILKVPTDTKAEKGMKS